MRHDCCKCWVHFVRQPQKWLNTRVLFCIESAFTPPDGADFMCPLFCLGSVLHWLVCRWGSHLHFGSCLWIWIPLGHCQMCSKLIDIRLWQNRLEDLASASWKSRFVNVNDDSKFRSFAVIDVINSKYATCSVPLHKRTDGCCLCNSQSAAVGNMVAVLCCARC